MKQCEGGCQCGACRYTATWEQPEEMYLCHCSRCRKETGTSHGANVFIKDAQFLWKQGSNNITFYRIENTKKERAFCTSCGSPVPIQLDERTWTIPAGSLDDDTFLTPTAHIFYGSRASWEDKKTNLKRFDGLPTPSPKPVAETAELEETTKQEHGKYARLFGTPKTPESGSDASCIPGCVTS